MIDVHCFSLKLPSRAPSSHILNWAPHGLKRDMNTPQIHRPRIVLVPLDLHQSIHREPVLPTMPVKNTVSLCRTTIIVCICIALDV